MLRRQLIRELGHDIWSPVDFFNFFVSVRVDKLLDSHEASTNSDKDLASLLDFEINSLLTEPVDTLWFSQEHDVHSITLRELVYPACEGQIDFVVLVSDVDDLGVLQLGTDILQFRNFGLSEGDPSHEGLLQLFGLAFVGFNIFLKLLVGSVEVV